MKRSICTTLLAVAAAVLISVQAQAASLFPDTAVYADQFVDVKSSDWFHKNVASLYALGLTNGKGDTHHFAPADNMTLAEAATMAARLRSLYEFGSVEAGADAQQVGSTDWYAPYVSYLQAAKVITSEFNGRWNTPATRAEMAHILARVLPKELFEEINKDAVTVGYASRRFITDVTEYTPYQKDILTLYRWGILSGSDSKGTFLPASSIKRSEVAAMITRLVDSSLRITLDWKVTEKTYLSLADLISGGVYHAAPHPSDSAAVDETVRYMLQRGESTITLEYPSPMTQKYAAAIMESFLTAVRRYPEQTYNKLTVSSSPRQW